MADTPLAITDIESIAEAVMALIAHYPSLPFPANAETIEWQNLCKGVGIGVFTMQGAIYKTRYVSGSYRGLVPLRFMYKAHPRSSKERLEAQKLLENLVKWLDTCTATFTDNHTALERIERTSPVVKANAVDSGADIYTCTANVTYFFKK